MNRDGVADYARYGVTNSALSVGEQPRDGSDLRLFLPVRRLGDCARCSEGRRQGERLHARVARRQPDDAEARGRRVHERHERATIRLQPRRDETRHPDPDRRSRRGRRHERRALDDDRGHRDAAAQPRPALAPDRRSADPGQHRDVRVPRPGQPAGADGDVGRRRRRPSPPPPVPPAPEPTAPAPDPDADARPGPGPDAGAHAHPGPGLGPAPGSRSPVARRGTRSSPTTSTARAWTPAQWNVQDNSNFGSGNNEDECYKAANTTVGDGSAQADGKRVTVVRVLQRWWQRTTSPPAW